MSRFVQKHELASATGLSTSTLKQYRLKGIWQEGIHWQRISRNCVVYNLALILDWMANRHDPIAHERAICAYLQALPSNQPNVRTGRSR